VLIMAGAIVVFVGSRAKAYSKIAEDNGTVNLLEQAIEKKSAPKLCEKW